ncbi:MAG: DEAD/DEAH box helicase [Thiotrichaceae bacterium]|nr:DEAD/DEAH box helicase [Thiotrichaceae bacterium]
MSFQSFNLNEDLAASLNAAGYENPTPLQKSLIPLVNERKNVVIESQTAAGKTGGYLIPLTSYLLNNPIDDYRGSRILILTSRRERVNQINYTLKKIIKDFNLRLGFISGGRPYQHQMRLLKRPLDFLIATPGRLDDLVKNNKTDFSNIEALVIDDFSIIHKQGLHLLCEQIYKQVKRECPVITFIEKNSESKAFLDSFVKDSEVVEIEEEKNPLVSTPQEVYITDDYTHKVALMDLMLDDLEGKSSLIFVSTNKAATGLQESLSNHGHPSIIASQSKDNERFTEDDYPILIVSDQVDSNIHTAGYKNIFHFDLPRQVSIFQSRVVNRGWEDLERPAAILVDPHNRVTLKKIEAQAGEGLTQNQVPGLEPMNIYISTPLLSLGGKKKPNRSQKGGRRQNSSGGRNNPQSKNNNRQKQHKGQYGRLSGGIHRKNSRTKVKTNSPRGNARFTNRNNSNSNQNQGGNQGNNPMFSSGEDESFANEVKALQEKEAKQSKVVIRYRDRKSRRSMTSQSSPESELEPPESGNSAD